MKSIISLLFFMLCFSAFPQGMADTAFLITAKQNSFELYQKVLRSQARLFNGSKFVPPPHSPEEHPFFSSEDWIMGSVFYDGEYFQNVPLMFDLSGSALITEHYPSGQPIQLVHEKLQHFTLDGHHFEKIENESVGNSLPATTFYEVLYSGETKVIVYHRKFIRDIIESHGIERLYEEKTRYFIFRNGVYFPVKSKASVLKVLSEKKQNLRKFLKEQRIPFSDDRASLLKKLAAHYDALK